jgi:hypothetical protein
VQYSRTWIFLEQQLSENSEKERKTKVEGIENITIFSMLQCVRSMYIPDDKIHVSQELLSVVMIVAFCGKWAS